MKKILLISVLVMVAFSTVFANTAFFNSVKNKTFTSTTDGSVWKFSSDGKTITDSEGGVVTFTNATSNTVGNYTTTIDGVALYLTVTLSGRNMTLSGYAVVNGRRVDIDTSRGVLK